MRPDRTTDPAKPIKGIEMDIKKRIWGDPERTAYVVDGYAPGGRRIRRQFKTKRVVPLGTPDGWTAVGWWIDGKPWVRVGCRNKSLSDGKWYWAKKPNRREVMAAVEYFEAVAAIRGQLDDKGESG